MYYPVVNQLCFYCIMDIYIIRIPYSFQVFISVCLALEHSVYYDDVKPIFQNICKVFGQGENRGGGPIFDNS